MIRQIWQNAALSIRASVGLRVRGFVGLILGLLIVSACDSSQDTDSFYDACVGFAPNMLTDAEPKSLSHTCECTERILKSEVSSEQIMALTIGMRSFENTSDGVRFPNFSDPPMEDERIILVAFSGSLSACHAQYSEDK